MVSELKMVDLTFSYFPSYFIFIFLLVSCFELRIRIQHGIICDYYKLSQVMVI